MRTNHITVNNINQSESSKLTRPWLLGGSAMAPLQLTHYKFITLCLHLTLYGKERKDVTLQ